jgi:enterochelin esterase-like enzyme
LEALGDEEGLLERAQAEGTPVLDGDTATFVWRGERAPMLIGDFNGFGWGQPRITMQQVAPGVWTHCMHLQPDAYLEYLFRDGDERVFDPLNPRIVGNGIGGEHNYFFMPEMEDTELAQEQPGVAHGEITEHEIYNEFLLVGSRRKVYLYHPPVSDVCPLLVVFDAEDYLLRARLPMIVDNLIAQKRLRPLAMALVNHGEQARAIEYNSSDSTVGMVVDLVLPLARRNLNLLSTWHVPGAYGLLGASMGGLQALYTAMRMPDIFGRVISQAGAFGPVPEQRVINDMVRYFPPPPLNIWLGVGQYDILLESNRELYSLLVERGYDVAHREFAGGHNYTSWRNDVWRGLEKVYGV